MKYLILLLTCSCVYIHDGSINQKQPIVHDKPTTKKPHIVHSVGTCIEFIKKAEEEWETQPQVIIKIQKVGNKKYLVTVEGKDKRKYRPLSVHKFQLEDKEPIACP